MAYVVGVSMSYAMLWFIQKYVVVYLIIGLSIQGGPERMQHLRSIISRKGGTE